MSAFKTQTLLDITLDTGIDISTASSLSIRYKKPSGETGSWSGTLSGLTSITYGVQSGDIDEAGTWRFQAVVVISGETGYGEIVTHNFKTPIEI